MHELNVCFIPVLYLFRIIIENMYGTCAEHVWRMSETGGSHLSSIRR